MFAKFERSELSNSSRDIKLFGKLVQSCIQQRIFRGLEDRDWLIVPLALEFLAEAVRGLNEASSSMMYSNCPTNSFLVLNVLIKRVSDLVGVISSRYTAGVAQKENKDLIRMERRRQQPRPVGRFSIRLGREELVWEPDIDIIKLKIAFHI